MHPFHLVDERPWPVIRARATMFTLLGLIRLFDGSGVTSILLRRAGLSLVLSVWQWWRDIGREGKLRGHHTGGVSYGLKVGMVLFIVSEVCFFFSFFWAFFHSRLSPTLEIGLSWPPARIKGFNPFSVPLLNTAILLVSGVAVTWAHHALVGGHHSAACAGLLCTVVLGLYFTLVQLYEYFGASFSISDAVYGSRFFVATGFHGFHVIVGSTFLAVCLCRLVRGRFSSKHHVGFEASAWYWHFVDVVWLFLYVSVYWWGR